MSLADGSKTAVGEFYDNYGRWPNAASANESVGLASPLSISGSYVGPVVVCGGACVDGTAGSSFELPLNQAAARFRNSEGAHIRPRFRLT